MIIGIDGNEANVKNKVGVGYYAFNLLKALKKEDRKNEYWIYLKNKPLEDMPIESPSWKYIVMGPKKMWTRFALPLKLYTQIKKPNIFISPSHYTPFFCPVPKIVSIMDLGYLDTPEQFTKKDFYQLKNWTEGSLKTSQHVITISEFCKKDIVKRYKISPDKISILYPIVDNPPISIAKPKYKDYFLYIGTLKPSKNIPFLINAFKTYLDKNLKNRSKKLIIAGKKGWLYEDIFALVKKLHISKNIIFTGYIDEKTKWSLLKYTSALIIPSLYEGFGIPVVEAMKTNTPVISSNRGSLLEINKDYGQIVDPEDENELIMAMEKVSKVSKKIPQKYTQKEIIKQFQGIIKHVSR